MTTKFSKEFANIICFKKEQIINSFIQSKELTEDFLDLRFNVLLLYCEEFLDYLYNYRYNIDDIDNTVINFTTSINNDFIVNNITFLQHEIFLIFKYFRDSNFIINGVITNNIINIFMSMLDNTCS